MKFKKSYVIGLIALIILFIISEKLADSHFVPDFLHPSTKYGMWAFIIGGVSSISLVIGSLMGIWFNPKPWITASLTAFGAGALLAALSVELIAPTIMEIVGQIPSSIGETAHSKSHAVYTMMALVLGCIVGGVLFVVMDDAINSKGGYFRKVSTLIGYFKQNKKTENSQFSKSDLENVDVLELKEVKELHKKEHEHESGGAMGIWLGLLIDGIPESFVIGAGFLALLSAKLSSGASPEFTDVLPYTLIAGLFLSNFPEALGSSVGMKKQGMSTGKILLMWLSLVIIVAVGSVVGYWLGSEIPHEYEIGIEGIAAGAMLTMIAQTMIPEAVHIGGNKVVGLSTLIGYLSAVSFKLLE